ncbi:MAG: hypothetical protein U1B30_00940, partial [Pseudomonadota bacterium]|nr:hypothetical protein [Pseudomonadota bacterium]
TTLEIRLIDAHPVNIDKTIDKLALLLQNAEHQPRSQQRVRRTNQNSFDQSPLPAQPLSSIQVESELSQSIADSAPPEKIPLKHESSALQNDSDEVSFLNTISAATLIENSMAMIHQDPFLGSDKETDFNKYELMKRVDRIREILPALIEQPALQKNEGIKEFKTINGDSQVMITIGDGKKVCFEIPKRDFTTPDVGSSPTLWMFTKCKDDAIN